MQEQRILELIAKALAGEASGSELSEIERWMQEPGDNRALYEALKSGYEGAKTILKVDNSDEVFEKIMTKSKSKNEKSPHQIKPETKSYFGNWLKVAAAIAFFAFFAYSFLKISDEKNVPLTENIPIIEKKTPKGQKLKVRLPDGSFVWLNSESRMVYPEIFSDSIRNVELVGEAFFEVKKDSDRPMIVKSGNITTTVLGTSFNVNAYPENEKLAISLVSGKIKVSNTLGKSTVLLEEGYAVDYLKESHESKIREIDTRSLRWKSGILLFEDESFSSFVEKIERWYGVEVVTTGSAGKSNWMLNGEFDNVSLEELMKYVSYGAHFSYEIKTDTLKITFINKQNYMPMKK